MISDRDIGRSVVAVRRFESGVAWSWGLRTPREHSLLLGIGGTLALRTDAQSWLVPPTLGFWVPAGVACEVEGTAAAEVYRVEIDPGMSPRSWTSVVTVTVSRFLRETIIRLADDQIVGDERARTVMVMYDALRLAPAAGLDMAMPIDDRLRSIADALVADPADDRTLAEWGREVGAGTQTLARLFVAETGMTFAQWRLRGCCESSRWSGARVCSCRVGCGGGWGEWRGEDLAVVPAGFERCRVGAHR